MSSFARRLPAVLTGLMVGPVVSLGAAWWTRLPEPSATHWGPSGVADGHGPRWLLVLLPVFAIGGMTIAGAGGGWRGVRAVWSTGLGPLVAVTTGGVTVLALRANLDAPGWRDARELGGCLAVAGVLVMATSSVGIGVTLFATSLVTATFSSASIQADTSGFHVRLGPLGLPRVSVPIEDIVAAQSLPRLEPLEWGGWGYRGSLSMFGSAAVVLRRGEALVLELSRNRRFVVTTSDSEQAAQLLNDAIRRR